MGSPIPAFFKAFDAHSHADLELFLHEDVSYRVEGFASVEGRRNVVSYWRRMFVSYSLIRMRLERHVRDGNVVIVSHRQTYASPKRPPLVLDGMAIFDLAQERVRVWDDRLRAVDLPPDEVSLWTRLRAARW